LPLIEIGAMLAAMKRVFQLVALDPPGLLIGGFAMQKYGLSRQTFDAICTKYGAPEAVDKLKAML
jgi:hypothetical protein